MVHLITGYAGKEHITSSDQGSFNAAVMGSGEFVLEGGEQFRCQVISNNKVRIFDGEALMQGRHIKIERNTYEETAHDNGTQGYQRIDLVVLTYTKNATTGIEGVTLDVIKGTPSASNPAVPEYETGDIINLGDLQNQMPLYKIPFDGLSIGEPVAMFKTISTLETMKAEIDAEVEAKKEELDEKFADLEGSIDEKIAEAGKPLSSNADDWALIEKYGEYSTDAKTVGEEFKKVNDSLVASDNLKFQFATDGEGNYGYLGADDSFIPFRHELSADVLLNVDVQLNVNAYGTNGYRGNLQANSTYYYEANFVIGGKNGTWSLTLPSDAKITKLRENIVSECSYDISYKIETTNSGSWRQETSGNMYESFVFKLVGIRNGLL